MNYGSHSISHGDRVTFTDRMGTQRAGRANGLLMFPSHLVLDMGGKYGTPHVVYPGQINAVRKKGKS